MGKRTKKVEEVIVSLTEDEALELAEESLRVGDGLSFPEGGGKYDEETIERIHSAVREVLHMSGVGRY